MLPVRRNDQRGDMMVRPILASATLALTLALAQPGAAQTQKWDQAAATQIAGDLETAVSGLRDIVRASPQLQVPSSNRTYIYQILDDLRQMEFMSQSLHSRLSAGEGLEETTPTYNKLQQTRRDTEVLAQKVDISTITKPKLDAAREQLAKLAPYYPGQPQVQDLK
jgi:hypothetical protein